MRLPTRLSRRDPDAHKGDFGHVLVLAGSARFSGAAALCALSAMRSGAGLVTLGIPESLNAAFVKIKPKEVMTLPLPETKKGSLSRQGYRIIKEFTRDIDVLIIGPGLGRESSTQQLARQVISGIDRPMVIDADGLFALKGHLALLKKSPGEKILTPHSGEMARLLGVSVKKIEAQREDIARRFAAKNEAVMVLKGHRTVVAGYKSGLYVNNTGNPGMSTAGSGDVLAGMIGAFLAQGLEAFSAAKYAVYLHGSAGDLAAKEKTQISLIASDIIDKIPAAIKRCS